MSHRRPHDRAPAATSLGLGTIDARAGRLIAVAAVCVAAAGCGGEHSSDLSRRQLVRRAQAICLRAQSAAGAMLPPSRHAGLAGTARYFEKSASIAAARSRELKALRVGPASPVAGQWNRVINAEEAFDARLRRLGQAAASRDVRRLELAQAATGPEQALIRSARRLGISLCAP